MGTHNFARVPELLDELRAHACRQVDLDRKANTFAIPTDVVAHSSPVRALRHRDGGLQPRLQLLRRAAHARAGGLPDRPTGRGRGASAGGARLPRGDAARPDRERVRARRARLRRAAASACRRSPALRGCASRRRIREHVDERHGATRCATCRRALPVPPPARADRAPTASWRTCAAATRATSTVETVAMLRRSLPDLALTSRRHRRLSRRDRGRVRGDGLARRARSASTASSSSRTRRVRAPRRFALVDDVPEDEKLRRLQVLNGDAAAAAGTHATLGAIGARQRVLVENATGAGRVSGRTPHFRIVHFDGEASQINSLGGRGDHRRHAELAARKRRRRALTLTGGFPAPIFVRPTRWRCRSR